MSLRSAWEWDRVWPDVAAQFNSLITSLSAEEAVAMGAHFALGVPYAKVAAYLDVSPKRAQSLAASAVRKMRHMIRVRNLYARTAAIVVLGHFTGAQAAACPLITWLAEEFRVDIAWAPFWAWSVELFVGTEVRPCPGCRNPILRDGHQDGVASLQGELGRPRHYCSNACRQKAYRERRLAARTAS